MYKALIVIILILSIFLLQGCNIKGNSRNMSIQNEILKEKKEFIKEYSGFVSSNKDGLIEIYRWLNNKKGLFYLNIGNGKSTIDTDKGEDYRESNKYTKRLIALMRKYSFNSLTQEDSGKDIIFTKILQTHERFTMHRLIYHKGKLDPETQKDYVKIADNFYYSYTVGE